MSLSSSRFALKNYIVYIDTLFLLHDLLLQHSGLIYLV